VILVNANMLLYTEDRLSKRADPVQSWFDQSRKDEIDLLFKIRE
jgi:hypothetical protein